MKKKGKIYSNRQRFIIYVLFLIILFILPGQNYYQTLIFAKQRPLIREVPISYSPPAAYPVLSGYYPKNLTATGIVIFDIPSGTLLYSKNPDLSLTPASTTKIMTAIIALENYPLNKTITIKRLTPDGVKMGLQIGDQINVESLLYGLLIPSDNDVAYALADNFNGGIDKFIHSMNKKAEELNMKNTHFNNVNGLENNNHYTSALDLARLTVYALNNPVFARIVSTPEITVPNFNFTKWYSLKNVNKLLSEIPGVYGVKTGFTDEAGECLVTAVKRGDRKILTVILKSQDRFGETAYLINWVFFNFTWQQPSLQEPPEYKP